MKKDIANNIKILMLLVLFVEFCSLSLSYLFKINLTIITMGGAFAATGMYAYSRVEMNDEEIGVNFKLLGLSILLGVYGLIYSTFYANIYKAVINLPIGDPMLGNMYKDMASSLLSLSIIISILLTFFIVIYLKNEDRREKILSLQDISFTNIKKEKDKISDEPDIKLCIDKDTGEPVIWPHKDRYVHLLCLGPTGSGKTSQTIIPLINQDMQKENIGITVLEPKSDLAEKVWALAKHYDKPVIYFNPILPDCPYFNPCHGREEDVIENMTTTFKMLSPDSSQFFQDQNENLLRNALKVLKRLEAAYPERHHTTLIALSRLLQNINDEGRKTVIEFSRLSGTDEMVKENQDIAAWFLNDYFTGAGGGVKGGTKTYEHCSGIRTQIAKLISNKYLRKVLNPPLGRNDIDFEKHLADGGVIALTTSQGDLRDLAKTLGLFLILQFQAAVFRRPLPEDSRRPHMFYLDEFQEFANESFGIMLTQGRSYRVGCHMATQARDQIAVGRSGKNFLSLVSANARSLVIYPGIEAGDAEYYSRQFGEEKKESANEVEIVKPFDPFRGNMSYSRDVTRRVEKVTKARFSASDIRFRPFKEITYCIVKNNTLQAPGAGVIEFIPAELNAKLDAMLEDFRAENKRKQNQSSEVEIKKDIARIEKTMYDVEGRKLSNDVEVKQDFDAELNDLFGDEVLGVDYDLPELDEIEDFSPPAPGIQEEITSENIIADSEELDFDDILG